jgi:hypothetical protein
MKRFQCWLLAIVLLMAGSNSFAQTTVGEAYQIERIKVSYIIAFGRLPKDGERDYWKGQGKLTTGQLVDLHKKFIAGDVSSQHTVITKAYIDATGDVPGQDDIARNISQLKGNLTYTEMMKRLMNNLYSNAAAYDRVVDLSYRAAFGRSPKEGEWKHWRSQTRCSYLMLVSFHESWKKDNPGSIGLTNGSNAINFNALQRIAAVNVSLSVAREAAGIVGNAGGNMVAAGGGNIVAAGAGNMVAAGGGNMVAAGGGN